MTSPRPREPLSLRQPELPADVLSVSKIRCANVTERGTDVKGKVSIPVTAVVTPRTIQSAGSPALCYTLIMTAKALKEAMERVESWPEQAQEELAEIALEIDASLKGETYHATPEQLEGIDRGLKAANQGRFATDQQVAAVIAKHRRS